MPWKHIDVEKVGTGDRLRVEGGHPFVVQAVIGMRSFHLSVIDASGIPWDIRDTDLLERDEGELQS